MERRRRREEMHRKLIWPKLFMISESSESTLSFNYTITVTIA